MFSSLRKVGVSIFHNVKLHNNLVTIAKMSSSGNFQTLNVTVPKPFVYLVELNRPNKMNAMDDVMWDEIRKCFEQLHENADCRAIVLSAVGKVFTAGIDLNSMMKMAPALAEETDLSRKAKVLISNIRRYQNSLTSLELCSKPVIAAVHSACIGAGVDMITAADIRYCTKDSYFQVKEVGIGMAADVGTLQRLPRVIGSDSLARELCYTARKMPADEALSCGLVSKMFDNKESLISASIELAEDIASKSPVAVQATKLSIVYGRDHTVQEGLEQMAQLNQFLLQSEDFTNAVVGQVSKQDKVVFAKL